MKYKIHTKYRGKKVPLRVVSIISEIDGMVQVRLDDGNTAFIPKTMIHK